MAATDEDFDTEYLSLDIAAAVVADLDAAIAHINAHGTGHTEAIVTRSISAADEFIARVDAAAVMVNASTAFTDGGEFGFGAEIGISTQKLHARGPMGLAELTSTKYVVTGSGQIRASLVTCVRGRPRRRDGRHLRPDPPRAPGRRHARSPSRFALDEVVFVPTGQPWQKSGREPGRAPLPDDGHRDRVQPAVHRVAGWTSTGRGRPTPRTRCATCGPPSRTPSGSSSPAPTRWPRSCPGRTSTSCSSWRTSSA